MAVSGVTAMLSLGYIGYKAYQRKQLRRHNLIQMTLRRYQDIPNAATVEQSMDNCPNRPDIVCIGALAVDNVRPGAVSVTA